MSTMPEYEESASTVGSILQQARIRTGHDVPSMANLLKIRQPFLEAIEQGRYDLLPGPAYASGFIRAYAEQLGLDGDQFIQRFRQETSTKSSAVDLQFPSPVADSGKPTALMIAIGLLVLAVAYGVWNAYDKPSLSLSEWIPPIPDQLARLLPGASTELDTDVREALEAEVGGLAMPDGSPAAPADAPIDAESIRAAAPLSPPVDVVPPSPVPTGPAVTEGQDPGAEPAGTVGGSPATAAADTAARTPPAEEVVRAPTAPAPTPAPGSERVFGDQMDARIVLKATQDSWIEVRNREAGEILAARLMRPGDVYLVPNRSGLTLLTGNAGGLDVYVDGNLAPPIGKPGVVRKDVALDAEALRVRGPAQ